jgi:hypothetical protein
VSCSWATWRPLHRQQLGEVTTAAAALGGHEPATTSTTSRSPQACIEPRAWRIGDRRELVADVQQLGALGDHCTGSSTATPHPEPLTAACRAPGGHGDVGAALAQYGAASRVIRWPQRQRNCWPTA